LNIYNCITNWK